MKHSLLSSIIVPILLLISCIDFLHAQEEQTPVRTGPGKYRKPRVIFFEKKRFPKLYTLAEKRISEIQVKNDTESRFKRITRIRSDSVYLDGKGYTFHDLSKIGLSMTIHYRQSDSAAWKVYFPPDSIFTSRYYYSRYIHSLVRQVKKDKFEWLAPPFRPNIVKFNISKLANLEFAIGYEWRLSKIFSLDIETGYQYAAIRGQADDFFMDLYPLYKYDGFTFVGGCKTYFNSRGYVELLSHYKYLVMTQTKTLFAGDGRYAFQDQYRTDYGFSIRIGEMTRIGDFAIFEGYFGLGVMVANVHQLIYGSYDEDSSIIRWRNPDHSPVANDTEVILPIVNAGIKIGVGF